MLVVVVVVGGISEREERKSPTATVAFRVRSLQLHVEQKHRRRNIHNINKRKEK
jgi:hypothetical protein